MLKSSRIVRLCEWFDGFEGRLVGDVEEVEGEGETIVAENGEKA